MSIHQSERITTRCPACGNDTLFVGSGGHLTCSWLQCKSPSYDEALAWARRAAIREALKRGFIAGYEDATRAKVEDVWERSEARRTFDALGPGDGPCR